MTVSEMRDRGISVRAPIDAEALKALDAIPDRPTSGKTRQKLWDRRYGWTLKGGVDT